MTSSPPRTVDWDHLTTWTQLAPRQDRSRASSSTAVCDRERHKINTAPLHSRQMVLSKQIHFVEVELNILLEIGENVFLKFSPRLTVTGIL